MQGAFSVECNKHESLITEYLVYGHQLESAPDAFLPALAFLIY